MGDPRYAVKPLDESTWPAYAALIETNNGIFGGCWCMGFHDEVVEAASMPTPKRERKLRRVREGTARRARVRRG